jgi:hypothetical protein
MGATRVLKDTGALALGGVTAPSGVLWGVLLGVLQPVSTQARANIRRQSNFTVGILYLALRGVRCAVASTTTRTLSSTG